MKKRVKNLLLKNKYFVINIDKVTYSSNEEMGKGMITFTRTGGSEDPKSPHKVELSGGQLKQGSHYDESFSDEFLLKDGAIYTLSFGGQDMAGNIATDVSISNITFISFRYTFDE